MHISARTDYALRAMLVIADSHPRLMKAAEIATAEEIPVNFLTTILIDLRRSGLVRSVRGTDGGHGLARPAETISVGDILRAADGLLTTVRGRPTTQASYGGTARGLRNVWLTLDLAITEVVDRATLANLLADVADA